MTYEPPTLLAVRAYLLPRTGLPAVSLGIVGGSSHTSGYHLGWDRLRAHLGAADYSVRESPRDANPTGAAMALDIGNFARPDGRSLRDLSMWLASQAAAGAPGTSDIREIIYSPDGRVVRRWDRLAIRSTGDLSHLSHTHISYHRDSEQRDKLPLFRRYFEGDDVSAAEVWETKTTNVRQGKGTTTLQTLRYANEYAYRAAQSSAETLALMRVAAGEDMTAAVRAELDRHRALLVAELGENLAEQLKTELGDVPAETVEAAVARALARTSLAVAPPV